MILPSSSPPRWRMFLHRRFNILACLSLFALLTGQVLGNWHWIAELFSHFLPHYTLIFILAALLCIHHVRILWATLALLCAISLINTSVSPTPSTPTPHRLLWYNVHLDNPDASQESRFILQQQADIIALAEINFHNPAWQTLLQHYPHGCAHQEYSPFALAVFSKQPLAACEVHFIGEFAYIRAQYGSTTLFALHPPPPINATLAQARHNYFTQLIPLIQASQQTLVVGDLNNSPFSPLFRTFTQQSQLQATTHALQTTWRPFLLHIDHILSKNLTAQTHALPFQHSDHRALLAEW